MALDPKLMRAAKTAVDRYQRRYGVTFKDPTRDVLAPIRVGGVSGYFARSWPALYGASKLLPTRAVISGANKVHAALSPARLRKKYKGLEGVGADAVIQRLMKDPAYANAMKSSFGGPGALPNSDILAAARRVRAAQDGIL